MCTAFAFLDSTASVNGETMLTRPSFVTAIGALGSCPALMNAYAASTPWR
jgi:hypothetical protein